MRRLAELLTVPNQLTLVRLGFLPFFIIAIHEGRYGWALGLLAAAAITDGLDGLLARRLNQRTAVGAYLDPIADKLLLSSSFFVLSLNGKIPWWLTILVLGRDVLILAVCATVMLVSGYRSFPPSLLGKLTTMVEILWVLIVILDEVLQQRWVEIAHGWGIYFVAVLVVGSGLHYGMRLARQQAD